MASVALVHWRVFTVFFAVDDFGFVARAAAPLTLPEPFAHFFSHRYLSADLLYRACRLLFGVDPGPYHLVTVGLHLLNAELVFTATRRLLGDRAIATAASLIFAAHAAAYTPVAWVAAGFNELPVQALSLFSILLLQSDAAAPRAWKSAGMVACVIVATGFKQHAVLIPLYWLGVLAYLFVARRASVAAWGRFAVSVGLLAPFYAYFWVYVLPPMQTLFAGPYERVLYVPTLVGTSARYYLAALNPIPVWREPLGVQTGWMNPDELTFIGRVVGTLIAAGAFGIAVAAPGVRAYRGLVVGAGGLLAGLLVLPATMPLHTYEYYVYFVLPIAAVILAVAAVGGCGAFVCSLRQSTRMVLVGITMVALWFVGANLHATSGVVAQAGRARAIHKALQAVPIDTRVVVVPPSDAAHEDTAFGASVDALHGDRGLHIHFARKDEDPTTSSHGRQLLAVNRVADRAEVYFLDSAQWAEDGPSFTLTAGEVPAIQPVRVRSGRLAGIQLPAEALGRVACALEWDLYAADPQRGSVGQGRVPCREISGQFTTLSLQDRSAAAGEYFLRLSVVGDGILRLPTGMVRHYGSSLRVGDKPTGTALVHRVVTTSDAGTR